MADCNSLHAIDPRSPLTQCPLDPKRVSNHRDCGKQPGRVGRPRNLAIRWQIVSSCGFRIDRRRRLVHGLLRVGGDPGSTRRTTLDVRPRLARTAGNDMADSRACEISAGIACRWSEPQKPARYRDGPEACLSQVARSRPTKDELLAVSAALLSRNSGEKSRMAEDCLILRTLSKNWTSWDPSWTELRK